ncbi:polysaccharide pyruvyl transferase family protein [Lacticaseibacillus paracasei]|uniref:polysaccharide pyruvyl transferase family protein n=1 Tax=Lacticaseibacillus paracasei TaxID=1597 RepID=UPI002738F64C|nr:polysaccharide pyruvyl transferase family protein [Lacticaseibacillus paracasei]MDP4467180.1 polysaccharide pyruvyl transferase family protein [Lacticaseibacillus paracasei]
MKAQVITLISVANYGTQLQALATQEKLQQYFDEVEFIDYRRRDTFGIGLLRTFSKGNPIRGIAALPTIMFWHFRFGTFRRENLHMTHKKYVDQSDFTGFDADADYYVVGSDQVWNSGWNKRVIPALYLNFIPNSKPKMSFAASFGRDRLTDQEAAEVKEYLRPFSFLSVREPSGVRIIEDQLKIGHATQLLDPVLSLPASYWRKRAHTSSVRGKYILIYTLNKNRQLDDYAQKLAEKTGFKLIRFCTRFDQIFRNGQSKVIPNILSFVYLIDHAEYVITDSFHATAFSMLMNTPPICIYPGQYSNRISEFLALVKASNRHLLSYQDFDVVNRQVDFDTVNQILEQERAKTDQYIQEAVKAVDGQ